MISPFTRSLALIRRTQTCQTHHPTAIDHRSERIANHGEVLRASLQVSDHDGFRVRSLLGIRMSLSHQDGTLEGGEMLTAMVKQDFIVVQGECPPHGHPFLASLVGVSDGVAISQMVARLFRRRVNEKRFRVIVDLTGCSRPQMRMAEWKQVAFVRTIAARAGE